MKKYLSALPIIFSLISFQSFAENKAYCSGVGFAYDFDKGKVYHSKVFDYTIDESKSGWYEGELDSQWNRFVAKKASNVDSGNTYVEVYCRAYKDEKRDAKHDANEALDEFIAKFRRNDNSVIKFKRFSPSK